MTTFISLAILIFACVSSALAGLAAAAGSWVQMAYLFVLGAVTLAYYYQWEKVRLQEKLMEEKESAE